MWEANQVKRVTQFFSNRGFLQLDKSNETLIIASIYEMPTVKYWQILRRIMKESTMMIPEECRIGDTCFTSLANIGRNLYTRHVKNLDHLHKDITHSKHK